MADDEQNSTVNTTNEQEQNNQQNRQKREQENKPRFNIINFIVKHFSIIWKVALVIFVILFIIGIIQILITMPGLILGKLKEFASRFLSATQGWFNGDNISAIITEDEEIEIAQYIQDMGYDILGYGFGEATYDENSEETGKTGLENSTIKSFGRGFIQGIGDTITGKTTTNDYIKAYMVQNEATYTLTIWSLRGLFRSIFEGGASEDYAKGMINISVDETFGIREQMIKDAVSVDRERKLLRIRVSNRGFLTSASYYFNMANWTSRYGKPLELFLALHLSSMMPDLAYDLATAECFNTKVNIDLQTVNATYEVSYNGIQQEDIQKTYLKTRWDFNDSDLNYTGSKFQEFYDYVIAYSKSSYYKANEGIDLTYIGKQMQGETPIPQDQDYEDIPITNDVSSIRNNISSSYKNTSFNGMKTDATFTKIAVYREDRDLGGSSNNNSNTHSTNPSHSDNNSDEEEDDIQTRRVYHQHSFRSEVSNRQAVVDNSNLAGLSVEKVDALIDLIESGKRTQEVFWPRIKDVVNHWYYNKITYTYGRAGSASKRIKYEPDDENNSLYGVSGIVLNATFTSNVGVYYQLCEPEAEGPNEAIIALFKGGSGSLNDIPYNFEGKYYRYDGTRDTARKILNAKSGNGGYIFGGKSYNKEAVSVVKEPVSFFDIGEDGKTQENSYKNAYAAFAILERANSQEAEACYRNLKELLVYLKYFTEDELKDPLYQVLDWFMPGNLDESNLTKDANKYGIIVKKSAGQNIIAPGNAKVISVDDNSVTIKFTKVDAGKMSALTQKYIDEFYTIDENTVLDYEMVISGITPTVSEGQDISRGSSLGTASEDDVQVYMKYWDGSVIDDVIKYMKQENAEDVDDSEIRQHDNFGNNIG